MFSKILIANRGEIAVRIIRACREMGISTVAVYSTADKDALHVRMADESFCIGGPQVADSYLNMAAILEVAALSGAQAIHPGYGLLSEHSKFVAICKKCNIEFIGPSAEMIERLGDKAAAEVSEELTVSRNSIMPSFLQRLRLRAHSVTELYIWKSS